MLGQLHGYATNMFPHDHRLVLDILSRLHSRETNVAALGAMSAVQLKVPHTVIIRVGVVSAWYFTSVVDGRLRKRNRRNCNFDEVYKLFTAKPRRKSKRSAVVATFSYTPVTGQVRHKLRTICGWCLIYGWMRCTGC